MFLLNCKLSLLRKKRISFLYMFVVAILSAITFSSKPVLSKAVNDLENNTAALSGGISIGSTRVIYNEGDNGSVVRVINSSVMPFLIQTWVESYKGYGAENSPEIQPGTFITTPPLYRQDKGENSVRILRAGGDFPKDRESVFWLNVKSIAASEKPESDSNYVQFAFNTRIKLFYRPSGLVGKPAEAYKTLVFSLKGNTLTASNPSAYNVTINNLKVGGLSIDDADQRMVPPKGTQSWVLKDKTIDKSITYITLNDFGGLTDAITVNAQ
ncbi:molecular chaperone [Citrobacter braakii]|uniref:fimbrial biogenesis chaperone n=1 Tax=Citrobacter braakii TaxID=57706 RepID=UPI00351D385C